MLPIASFFSFFYFFLSVFPGHRTKCVLKINPMFLYFLLCSSSFYKNQLHLLKLQTPLRSSFVSIPVFLSGKPSDQPCTLHDRTTRCTPRQRTVVHHRGAQPSNKPSFTAVHHPNSKQASPELQTSTTKLQPRATGAPYDPSCAPSPPRPLQGRQQPCTALHRRRGSREGNPCAPKTCFKHFV